MHVDIDPEPNRPIDEERDRILRLLMDKLPKGIPEPTVIVFSGGGFQAFWKLKEPIEISGNIELAENAKRYNQKLEEDFGADNCHNIDRIMRLPGTYNVPDAKKRKKGRTKMLAKVIKFDKNLAYSISDFAPGAPIAAN